MKDAAPAEGEANADAPAEENKGGDAEMKDTEGKAE